MNKQKPTTCYYETVPKNPTPYDWVAPEHYRNALGMERVNGAFVIAEHPIFKYSRDNPPAWLVRAQAEAANG
jgi:hypothetical protein